MGLFSGGLDMAGKGWGPLSWLVRQLDNPLRYRRIRRSADRVVLEHDILPVFARECRSILFVGVRAYTKGYPDILERHGAVCWTCDILPKLARFGRPGRHETADVTRIDQHFAPGKFDAVLCNGLFGWGVDGAEAQTQALRAMARVLQPGGWLLLGWNEGRTAEVLELAALDELFQPSALGPIPAHRQVPGTTHRYDLLRKR